MRRVRAHTGSAGLLRSLALRTFVVAWAAILVVGAVALSSILTNGLRQSALEDNARLPPEATTAAVAVG